MYPRYDKAKTGKLLLRKLQFFNTNIPVTDELVCVVASAMNLKGDSPGIGMTLFRLLPFHHFHPIDPSRDFRRVSLDASAKFVPLAVTPKEWP